MLTLPGSRALTEFIRRRRVRSAARESYFTTEKNLSRCSNQLAETTDPRQRATILYRMAGLELTQADRHRTAFGDQPIKTEGGRDMAESLLYASMLYRTLGDVEHVVASGSGSRNCRFPRFGEDANDTLDRMCVTPDLPLRMALLEDLYDAVYQHLGGQAAEVLWTLPAPGFSGWLTSRDKQLWVMGKELGL